MRILHLADLHIGKWISGFSLLSQQEDALEQVLEVLEEEKIQAVVIAGDIYDKSIPSGEAVTLYNRFLAKVVLEKRIPVLAISGNHDSRERLEAGNMLSREAGYYVEGVLKKEISRITLQDEWGEVDFYLMAFGDVPQMKELYPQEEIKTFEQGWYALRKSIRLRPGVRCVAIAHCYALASTQSEEVTEMERIDSQKPLTLGGKDFMPGHLFLDFSYAALGHLHRSQKVIQDSIRYSGTLLKYSFSEEHHEKSMTIAHLDQQGLCAVRQVPVKQSREWRSLRGSFQEILAAAPQDPGKEDFIRFILTDADLIVDAMPRLKAYYPFAMELLYEEREKQRREHQRKEKQHQRSLLEMLDQFYGDLYDEKPLPGAVQEMAMEILKELEGKQDEA